MKTLTAFENLSISTQLYDVERKRIYELLETVGLSNAGKKKAKEFSLGMKQRLGIANAMVHSPKILILDEPTNGLDPAGIKDIRELLRKLAESLGITILVSSHILSEVQQVPFAVPAYISFIITKQADMDITYPVTSACVYFAVFMVMTLVYFKKADQNV